MVNKIATLFLKIITLPFWYLQVLLPRKKNLWLFGAGMGETYADNARITFEYVLKNEVDIQPVWVTRDERILKKLQKDGAPVVRTNSLKGIWFNLRAGVVFINNHPKDLNSRAINGAVQVWLWHGLMMKQIGEDAKKFSYKKLSSKGKVVRKFMMLFYPENTYIPDYAINTADFFTPFFSSAFNLKSEQVLISGYPRNDCLFEDEREPFLEKIDKQFNEPLKILYMPTWRDALFNNGEKFQPFNNFGFSLPVFLKFLKERNAVFLNKGHNYEKGKELFEGNAERFINVSNREIGNLYTFLKDVDILITDYSSVYFDFLLTKKPIILAPFDLDSYVAHSRPLYYDYNKFIDGVKAKDWPDLLSILEEERYYSPDDAIVTKFHRYQDDMSSKRVVEMIKSRLKIKS